MHVDVDGEGRPVLLLHGGGVAGWMWRPVRELVRDEFRTIVPDLPGHGRSAREPYVSHAATVHLLADAIRSRSPAGLPVVGFSLGAQLALRLASEHPSLVTGVVIVSGEAIPAPMPGLTLALLGWSAPLARNAWFAELQARQLGIPHTLADDYVRESRALSRDTLLTTVAENIRFTMPDAWRAFSGPATVMVGTRERRLMRRSARLIHEAAGGSALVAVAGAGHDIPFRHPDRLAEALRSSF